MARAKTLGFPSGGGQFATAPFSPLSLSPQGWWDGASGLTLNSANGGVNAWVDLIGGLTPVQATDASQPLPSKLSTNARPCVAFDAIDDFLSVDSTGALAVGGTQGELWMLIEWSAANGAVQHFFTYGGATAAVWRTLRRSGGGNASASAGDGTLSQVMTDTAIGTPSGVGIVRARFETAQAGVTRLPPALALTATNAPATTTTRTRIGAGNANTASLFGGGKIAIIMPVPLLDNTQASNLTTWFKREGGI